MEDIIIFSTYKNLINQINGKGIFKYGNVTTLNDGSEGFKLNGENIFAFPCLVREKGGDKKEHFKAIIKSVCNALQKQGVKAESINRVIVFAHGYDVDIMDNMAPIPDPSMEGKKGIENFYKILEEGAQASEWGGNLKFSMYKPGIKILDNKKSALIVGFSHTGNVLNELLASNTPIYGEPFSKVQALARFAELLHYPWSGEKAYDGLLDIPFSKQFKFMVNGYEQKVLSNKLPDNFVWEKASTIFTEASDENGHPVHIVFMPIGAISDFGAKDFFKQILETLLNGNSTAPVLFVSSANVMEDGKAPQINLDPRFRFLDSSIWCRYVSLGNFTEDIKKALETIAWAYKHNLYHKNVCREYIEFHGRMLDNSHLSDKFGTGHAKKVHPFIFHSEGKMQDKAKETRTWFKSDGKDLKWNVLLVDDFANNMLREKNNVLESQKGKNKKDIIESLITTEFAAGKNDIVKEYNEAVSPAEAVRLIGCNAAPNPDSPAVKLGFVRESLKPLSHVFDLILLDYLFSEPEGNQARGTDLLDMIKSAERRDGLGIAQRYWIYPITVFNEAIQSSMQEKGLQYVDEHWHLVRGADPINTPHLFRATLYQFMKAQAQEILFDEIELWAFLAEHGVVTHNGGTRLDRSAAIQAFRRFIERFSVDEGISEKSALGCTANEYLMQKPVTNNAGNAKEPKNSISVKELRDHIRQLFYLLGFSTGFDFPVIEREFQAIEYAFHSTQCDLGDTIRDRVNIALEHISEGIYSIEGKYF